MNRVDFSQMSDDELIDICFSVGLDSLPNTNQYGELNNRDEVIAALIQSHNDATADNMNEAFNRNFMKKLARKYIPKLGRYQARERMKDYESSADEFDYRAAEARALSGEERSGEQGGGEYTNIEANLLDRDARAWRRQAERYKRIAQGKHPFRMASEMNKHMTFKQFLMEEDDEKRIMTYSGWKRACKRVHPTCEFEGDKDIARAFIRKDSKIKDIGEWDGDHGVLYKHTLKENHMSGMKVFRVHIPANVYSGKYFDYRTASVYVFASTPDEAIEIVNANKQAVIEKLARTTSAYGLRKLIPSPAAKNIFFKSRYHVQPMKGYKLLALTSSGTFEKVQVDEQTGEWHLVSSDNVNESTLGRLARRTIPKLGRYQARERMKDYESSADEFDYRAAEARALSGEERSGEQGGGEYAADDAEMFDRAARLERRQAERYKRIAQGERPFKKDNVNEAKKFTGKPMFKPRAKDLNAALVSKKGGKHFTEKGQYKRSVEKQKMRREQDE